MRHLIVSDFPHSKISGRTIAPNTALQSDRFAREIVLFLMSSCAARSRRLNAKPLDAPSSSSSRIVLPSLYLWYHDTRPQSSASIRLA
jgi:hypothetical protein